MPGFTFAASFPLFPSSTLIYYVYSIADGATGSFTIETDQGSVDVNVDIPGISLYNPSSISVSTDCGDGGVVNLNQQLSEAGLAAFWWSVNGFGTIPDIGEEILPAGEYTLFIFSPSCIGVLEADITIPDGSFTVGVTTVNPIINCTSSTAEASGFVSGAVELQVAGGSGSYDSLDATLTIDQAHGNSTVIGSLGQTSPYTVLTTDINTGCQVEHVFTVASQTESIDVNFDVTNGLCISGTGTWPPVVTQNGMVVASESSSLLDFDLIGTTRVRPRAPL
ncbi:MAG: hypothetical protein ACFCUH_06065 [Flavobacteriales bacterium]